MLEAAREAIARSAQQPKLIAVTMLTSMAQQDLAEIGINTKLVDMVLRLATLARDCGLDGVVCSAQEAALLREHCGSKFCLVTPGIRAAHASLDDQSRVMTPKAAMQAGSSYLVIGRRYHPGSRSTAGLARDQSGACYEPEKRKRNSMNKNCAGQT